VGSGSNISFDLAAAPGHQLARASLFFIVIEVGDRQRVAFPRLASARHGKRCYTTTAFCYHLLVQPISAACLSINQLAL
jgi:hypothetical protein